MNVLINKYSFTGKMHLCFKWQYDVSNAHTRTAATLLVFYGNLKEDARNRAVSRSFLPPSCEERTGCLKIGPETATELRSTLLHV